MPDFHARIKPMPSSAKVQPDWYIEGTQITPVINQAITRAIIRGCNPGSFHAVGELPSPTMAKHKKLHKRPAEDLKWIYCHILI